MRFKDTYTDNEEILKDIKQEMDELEIPEELAPSKMMEKLEMLDGQNKEVATDKDSAIKDNKNNKKNKKKIIVLTSILSAVATIIIAITITLGYYGVFNTKEDENGNSVISDDNIKVYLDDNGFYKMTSYDNLGKYFAQKQRYEPFIDVFENLFSKGDYDEIQDNLGSMEGGKATSPDGDSAGGESINGDVTDTNPEYSDTNVRDKNVSEADIIKTDGKYIYVINDYDITIVKADGENSKILATIAATEDITKHVTGVNIYIEVREMYVVGNKLIVLSELYGYTDNESNDADEFLEDVYDDGVYDFSRTVIRTYDISDMDNITMIGDLAVDGYYDSSRMKDGYMYVFSSKYILSKKDYIPGINAEMFPEDEVYITAYSDYDAYTMITSVDIENPDKFVDYKAVIHSNEGRYYVSGSNIYLYNFYNAWNKTKTEIMKFSYDKGIISPVINKCIEGTIKDSFCIDEYNGYLRIVANTYNKNIESNSLYILDDKLEMVSEIKDIAKGERVYSARFMGDIGYFVTYYQVDPLFSVDLSNPKEPKIIGALKIPGFSEYLHAWGDNMLLGIGREGSDVKLSMFDISDPANVTEHNKLVLEGIYSTPAEYDYKTVLIDYEKNIIGFAVGGDEHIIIETENDIKHERKEIFRYVLYTYNENGFELIRSVELDNNYSYENMYSTRGLYIGEYLYVVHVNNKIEILKMDDYSSVCIVRM